MGAGSPLCVGVAHAGGVLLRVDLQHYVLDVYFICVLCDTRILAETGMGPSGFARPTVRGVCFDGFGVP